MRGNVGPGMRWAVIALAAGFLLVGCQIDAPPTAGHVVGLVGGWPAQPLGGDIAPAPDKTVEFHPNGGGSVSKTVSGHDGRYDVSLAPGGYEVQLAGYMPLALLYARDQKTYGQWPHVTVTAGHTTRLDLIYDTGIR
jgi:hypothetical protein